jgi:anaerobic selenocysteine-containing dehydrogenase
MAHEQAPSNRNVSRRDFLFVAAAGGGAICASGLVASPAEAAKMSPKAMAYRPKPNGTQSCQNCANFQPPASCRLVDGAISPSGWCILYRSK